MTDLGRIGVCDIWKKLTDSMSISVTSIRDGTDYLFSLRITGLDPTSELIAQIVDDVPPEAGREPGSFNWGLRWVAGAEVDMVSGFAFLGPNPPVEGIALIGGRSTIAEGEVVREFKLISFLDPPDALWFAWPTIGVQETVVRLPRPDELDG